MDRKKTESAAPRSAAPKSNWRSLFPEARSLKSRVPAFQFIYIPANQGTARPFRIPKVAVVLASVAVFTTVGALAAMGLNYAQLQGMVGDAERLRMENLSLRSEASALTERLRSVQSTLNQVDTFSDQLREVTRGTQSAAPGVPANGGKHRIAPKERPQGSLEKKLPDGIGPLSKEEFALVKAEALQAEAGGRSKFAMPDNVKFEKLEFKELFQKLDDIEEKGSSQAKELELLLTEVRQYRARLAATPNLAPVQGWVTSMYGVRNSPITGQNRMHHGMDIGAPLGSPIRTAADGVVRKVARTEDYGNYVEVLHGHGVMTRYAHAQLITVRPGEKVKKGGIIGKVGMTGRTTGPHLHYEIEVRGRRVNPGYFIQSW